MTQAWEERLSGEPLARDGSSFIFANSYERNVVPTGAQKCASLLQSASERTRRSHVTPFLLGEGSGG